MEQNNLENNIKKVEDEKEFELETQEAAIHLLEKTLLLNPENQKLSDIELRKLAIEELKNSQD